MSIKLQLPKLTDLRPRITVIGVGGAGGNALNNMIATGLTGVEFVAANTDAQHLALSSAEHRIQLGVNLTEGLGAGSKPEIGESAAEEAVDEIRQQLSGSHMCFIAAGMGGGTGTGAAAVFARVAKELDILTVGVVTKPFHFEGARRMRVAEVGVAELRKYVDTLIVIPNQNLFRIANEKTTFAEAFRLADQVLHSGIACIVDLIVREGLINLDFADVRTVMRDMGSAMMGTGEGSGERRAVLAAEEAIHNPLLDDVSLKGAKGLLLSITGGRDLTLYEVDEAASRVRQEVDPDANIIVGATFDESLVEKVRVSIVASGVGGSADRHFAERRQGFGDSPAFGMGNPAPVSTSSRWGAHNPVHANTGQAAQNPTRGSGPVTRGPQPQQQPQMPSGAAIGDDHALGQSRPPANAENAGEIWSMPAVANRNSGNLASGPGEDDDLLELGTAEEVQGSRNPWAAPDDVTIVEELPHLGDDPASGNGGGSPRQSARRDQAGGSAANNGPPSFQPSAPFDARSPLKRMPEVADFPVVGQRDYYAKTRPDNPSGAPRASEVDASPRRGFFDRWRSGGASRTPEPRQPAERSESNQPTRPKHDAVDHDRHRTHGADKASHGAQPRPHVEAREPQRGKPLPPPPRRDATGAKENADLPKFFQKSTKDGKS